MIAHVDINNFYASCEAAFQPWLKGRPVIVLSNNDGCVIARNREAKALDIDMAAPYFKIRKAFEAKGGVAFSSNYTLYGDMSRRFNAVLMRFSPEVERYSVDESFVDLSGFPHLDLQEYARQMRETIYKWTGLPCGVGVGPTKCLAKMANHLAKKQGGAYVLLEQENIDEALQSIRVAELWGIGRNHARFLNANGIHTAWEFTRQPGEWVRREMTVVGYRIWKELRGQPCHNLTMEIQPKKAICCSRSFGIYQSDIAPIITATANYAARVGEKLRKQHSCAAAIHVFLQTNSFNEQADQYHPSITIQMPVATASTMELVKVTTRTVMRMYKPGYVYKKSGVIALDIVPASQVQQGLFDKTGQEKHHRLSLLMDGINSRFGRNSLYIAQQENQDMKKPWQMKREMLSRCYTTDWNDVLAVGR